MESSKRPRCLSLFLSLIGLLQSIKFSCGFIGLSTNIGSLLIGPNSDLAVADEEDGGEEDEFVHVNETYYYLEYIIRFLGIIHAVISLCMLIAYYNLKVPLAIFKREKEVARR